MDIESRLSRLEVHVVGNGKYGLTDRMRLSEEKLKENEWRINEMEYKMQNTVTKESCAVRQGSLREIVEKALDNAFEKRKNTGLRLFLDWFTKIGPTLIGLAAILALLFK